MRIPTAVLAVPALLVLAAPPASATITYSHRDARFFGETSGRETTAQGAFDAATSTQLPVNFSTGGPTPTLFDALATTQVDQAARREACPRYEWVTSGTH